MVELVIGVFNAMALLVLLPTDVNSVKNITIHSELNYIYIYIYTYNA